MKVRLWNDAGYEGLANVQFPVEVEVERQGWSLYYVNYDVIAAIPGWFYHTDDTHEGSPYCFYKDEVEVVVNPQIRVHSPSGYSSLMNLDFPMVLEAHRIEEDGTAFVKASVLRAWGVETDDGDFVFLEEEYTLVEEKKSLAQLFGDNLSDGARADLEKAGDLAAKELAEVLWKPRTLDEAFGANPSPEALAANQRAADLSMKDMTDAMSGADRKGLLLQLILDYGVAINDGCYESECGTMQGYEECKAEEDRLLEEITKMIEEGV